MKRMKARIRGQGVKCTEGKREEVIRGDQRTIAENRNILSSRTVSKEGKTKREERTEETRREDSQ
jgi:hypothetical protein